MQQAKEAPEIYTRLGYTAQQPNILKRLAWLLLFDNNRLDIAEDTAFRAIKSSLEKDEDCVVYGSHTLGKREKVIHLYMALGIVSPLNRYDELFWIHFSHEKLFLVKTDKRPH